MDEYTRQPTRRRRQPAIPQWQRTLRKYWPPIRFGMICFIILAIVILLIDGIVGLFTKDTNNTTTTAVHISEQLSFEVSAPIIETEHFCI